MAIMFKKTAVILFLLSQHVFVSSSASELKKRKISRSAFNPMALRSRTVSPSAVNELSSPSTSSSSSTISTSSSSSNAAAATLTGASDVDIPEWEKIHFAGVDEMHANDFIGSSNQALEEDFFSKKLLEDIHKGDLAQVQAVFNQCPAVFSVINDLSDFFGGISPFLHAVKSKDRPMVDFLVSTGKVDPNAKSSPFYYVLSSVIEDFEDAKLVKSILDSSEIKIDVNPAFRIMEKLILYESPLFTPVMDAMIAGGKKDIVAVFIVMAKDAVCNNNTKLVRLFAAHNVPLHLKYKSGIYFLHFAAIRNHLEMVDLLLELGAPIDCLCGNENFSALEVAYYGGKYALASHLISKGAIAGLEKVVMHAIDNHIVDVFHAFACNRRDFSSFILPNGYNVITYCIAMDRPDFLSSCLHRIDYSADLYIPDRENRTIYTMELPANASGYLRTIIESERNAILSPNDFINIQSLLEDEETKN